VDARAADPAAAAEAAMSARDDAALRDALLRFLLRERAASRQGLDETYSLPVPARVDAGDAIAGVRPVAWRPDGRIELFAPHNQSGFRTGDRLRIGAGDDPESEPEVQFVEYEPAGGRLIVELPPYGADRGGVERVLAARGELVLDKAGVDMTDPLRRALDRVYSGTGAVERSIRDLLGLRLAPRAQPALDETAGASLARLETRGYALGASQKGAFRQSWSREPYHLVQGPPGTGKTFVLALLLAAMAWRGERILVTAQTHLAVDNVLVALARIVAREGRPLRIVRITRQTSGDLLDGLPVERASRARAVGFAGRAGAVVGATLYAALSFADDRPFHRVVFDEAAQIPLPHALCALLTAPRWLFFGDDCQLGPVIVGEHDDDLGSRSVFTHLRGAVEPALLDETHRMNGAVCAFPSAAFYGGRLRPSAAAAPRIFPHRDSDGPFAPVLDPAAGAVLVRIDHEGYHTHCPHEVRAAADIAVELLERHGLDPGDLAIVAPFRVQSREIARELRRRLGASARLPVVDTVERVQGQEREAVIVSLTCSDPDALRDRTEFFFSPNRLCVTLTRSRTKLIVLASRHLLRTFPRDHEGLRRLDVFHRMFRELPQVDWTARYIEP
jgi:DNA replication ATP-dependent helicase Dna2